MIDEVKEILGDDFEIIIINNKYDEKMITLVDRTGAIGPYSYNYTTDNIDINKWLKVLENSLKENNWKHSSSFHSERIELLLSLMNKVKRIRKINEILNNR